MLKRYEGRKTVHVDALAGSIASIIAFADSEAPTIPANAYLMIHKPWAGCEGNSSELRKMADTLDSIESGIWNIYEEHLAEGVSIETIKELMEAETWLNGKEAAQYFKVKVGAENEAVAAVQDYTENYCHNVPKDLLKNSLETTSEQEKDTEKRNAIIKMIIAHMGQ